MFLNRNAITKLLSMILQMRMNFGERSSRTTRAPECLERYLDERPTMPWLPSIAGRIELTIFFPLKNNNFILLGKSHIDSLRIPHPWVDPVSPCLSPNRNYSHHGELLCCRLAACFGLPLGQRSVWESSQSGSAMAFEFVWPDPTVKLKHSATLCWSSPDSSWSKVRTCITIWCPAYSSIRRYFSLDSWSATCTEPDWQVPWQSLSMKNRLIPRMIWLRVECCGLQLLWIGYFPSWLQRRWEFYLIT